MVPESLFSIWMGVGGKLMCCFSWVGGPTIIIIIIITSGALE